MPKFCLQNPTMLYAIGEARMALGDQQGGLQMIGYAAAKTDNSAKASKIESAKPQAKPVEDGTKCARTAPKPLPQSVVTVRPTMVKYRYSQRPDHEFVKLAKLERVDFGAQGFDQAAFAEHMRRTSEAQKAAQAEQLHRTLARVRYELERQGIAVPLNIPQPPVASIVTP